MSKMKNISLFPTIVLLLLIQCSKDLSPTADECIDESGNPYFCVDADFIEEFGAFGIGSLWVYAERRSGEIDSVSSTYYSRKISQSNLDSLYYETISFILSSTANDRLFCYLGTLDSGTKSNFYFTYPISNGLGVAKKNGQYEGSCLASVLGLSCDVSVEVVGDMEVNGVTFNDVLKVYGGDTVNPNPIDSLYHARGIGIIRKLYRNGDIYELIDYHIVSP